MLPRCRAPSARRFAPGNLIGDHRDVSVEVLVTDETTGGDVLGELALQLEAERTTIREIIQTRVQAEVRAHNASSALGAFKGLVQPTDAEEQLNRGRTR